MTDTEKLTSLLEAIAVIPAKGDWHVAPIHSLDAVLLCDDRDEATLPIMEAIASQHGKAIATGSVGGTASGRELAGCLIRPRSETNLKGTADALRLSYALGIEAGTSEPPDIGI